MRLRGGENLSARGRKRFSDRFVKEVGGNKKLTKIK